MTCFHVTLLLTLVLFLPGHLAANPKSNLVMRFRTMVSKELTPTQVSNLLNHLSNLMVANYPADKLTYELSNRLLNISTPLQKIHWIATFNCYESSFGEFDAKALFEKTKEITGTFFSPVIAQIYDTLNVLRLAGLSTIHQQPFVLRQINTIVTDGFIRSIFTSLSQLLSKEEIKVHANCGGRIIMFSQYFTV